MSCEDAGTVIVYAPTVRVGGGLVLLRALLSSKELPFRRAYLSERLRRFVPESQRGAVHFTSGSVLSRMRAEVCLRREACDSDVVLCFNGLPPLLRLPCRVVVYLQNRILVDSSPLDGYGFGTKVRLRIERLWLRRARQHAERYVVQTPSMERALRGVLRTGAEISVFPFCPRHTSRTSGRDVGEQKFDFVYVASGEAHKNHANLLDAWRLLAEQGFRPSLALTVDPLRYTELNTRIVEATRKFSLNIVNVGDLAPEAVAALYNGSSALIYPSKTESFGLPLIEAARHNLPIVAAELDYVRDVAVPAETFDPSTPVSIARAVRRFLGVAESPVAVQSAEDFLLECLR